MTPGSLGRIWRSSHSLSLQPTAAQSIVTTCLGPQVNGALSTLPMPAYTHDSRVTWAYLEILPSLSLQPTAASGVIRTCFAAEANGKCALREALALPQQDVLQLSCSTRKGCTDVRQPQQLLVPLLC